MIATASARLRILCCSLIINGHVATTIIAAQTIASRNGRRTQNDAPMSINISSTASTVRVRSRVAPELEGSVVMDAARSSRGSRLGVRLATRLVLARGPPAASIPMPGSLELASGDLCFQLQSGRLAWYEKPWC